MKEMKEQEIQELIILQGAIENANEAFITIDEEHRILFFNRAAEKIFGYPRREVIGRDLCILLDPELRETHPHAVQRYLQGREPRLIGRETELTAVRRTGDSFPASISFSVAEIRERTFFTAIIRDMTETRSLQRQVAQSERLALLGQVAAEISHEIKNPLVMIGGWARRLHKTLPDEDARQRLNYIIAEVQRLEHLLAELRNLYVPRKMATEEINGRELLEEAFRLVKAECEDKMIGVHLIIRGASPVIRGDREKLLQVLLNIIKNGMEALASTGGNLLLGLETVEDSVEFSVVDDGPGIPAAVLPNLFTPFFTTKHQGTGLGLCISKRILDDHPGSSLVIETPKGGGTMVKIKFANLGNPPNHGKEKR
jgi:two-component system, LuxR family, sensor kinase FixL